MLVTTGLIALINSDWAIFDPITIENPGTVYIATVTLVAMLIGAGPALVTAVASMLMVFLAYAKYESVERSIVLIGTMLIIIGLAAWQRRARDAAERTQAKFEAILESMSDAVMVVDAAGRSTDVNHAAIAMLGAADRADALTKLTDRRTDDTPATDEYAMLERVLAGEETTQQDVLIPDAPGGPRIVSAVASPMRDARGRIIGAVSVSRDMTDRLAQTRERESLLRRIEQEQQFTAQVLADVPVGIAVVRADDFTVLSFNNEYDASIRNAPGSQPLIVGQSLLDAMPAASHDAATALLSRARDAQTTIHRPAYAAAVAPDQFYDGTIQPLHLGDGTPALLITAINVTERLEREREGERLQTLLEERRQFTQAIFDVVPVCLAVVDTDAMVFSAANPAFIEATPESYRNLGVSGHALATVLPHTVENGFVNQLRHTGRTGERFEASATRYEHPTRGATFWNETMIPLTTSDPGAHHVLYIAADVTKEVEAQRRIVALAREAAQRAAELEAIITNMPDGVGLYGANGQLLQMNLAGRAISGEDPSPDDSLPEVVERFDLRYSDGRVIPLDDLPLPRALRGETVSGYEFISHTRYGARTILASSAPIRDASGEITSAVVVFSDISERRAAEEQREQLLREVDARRRFVQTVVESTPVGIAAFGVDADFTVRMANDQYLQLLDPSWRDTGITGHGVREVVPDADAAGLIALAQQVIERGESIMLREFEFNGFARGAGYFDASIVPLRESGAHVTGVLTVVADVTERVESRHRIEELAWDAAQRASELETVIASIADGVMMTDAEGRIILENDAARRLTGRTQSAVSLGLEAQIAVYALRAPDGTPIPPAELPLGRAVRGETVAEQVLIVRRADTGEDRFLMCSSAPVRAGGDAITGAVAVFRDITEMKQIDQMKDDFVSIAAHELRTPLTAIKGYAELLERRLSMQQGRESDQRSLGVIRKQTERLASLVNEMLDVSRIEGGRLQLNAEPFDLSALISEVVSNMRVSSETHLLSLAAVPGIEVNGDAARIEQVLLNLITNAITYSPEGGEVDVRVWTEENAALVSIRDQGVGIASDELPQLFDRFYRAPRAGVMRSGGMGLGLYICREIVARHGGTIRAESVEGMGSTFTFSLPLAEKGKGSRTED